MLYSLLRIFTSTSKFFQNGYGSRALALLKDYYEFKMTNLDDDLPDVDFQEGNTDEIENDEMGLLGETIEPRKSLPPLLLKLNERKPEKLDYMGVSFGLTGELLKFWFVQTVIRTRHV